MTNRHYFHDTTSVGLAAHDDSLVDTFSDTTDADFDPSAAQTVTRDDGWGEFFGTSEFVAFDSTVAKPITQPYQYNGEIHTFRKDETELKQAQPQIENLPWTMGHPPKDRVTHADQIRGVWTNPRWDDGQVATLHIPVTDTEAIRYAVHNDEVSVGFGGTLDWADDESVEYDATQRSMAYDHIASVENGRCSREDGCGLHEETAHGMSDSIKDGNQTRCGLHTDDNDDVGHVIADAARTTVTEEGAMDPAETDVSDPAYAVGEWVKWNASNGPAHGKVDEIVRDGWTTRGKGEREICADDDDPAVVIEHYDGSEPSGDYVRHKMSTLESWIGPQTDACDGICCCGCHDGPYLDNAPKGVHVNEGGWYGIAPDENPDDEYKYELDNCNDVKDAYNLRNNGDYDVATDTLVARITRAAQAHDCPSDRLPDGLVEMMTDSADNTPMSNMDLQTFIDENELSVEDVVDALDVDIPSEPTAFYDGEPSVEQLADDFDAVDILVDEKQSLEDEVSDLTDSLREAKRPVYKEKAQQLADMTHKWGDSEELMERFDADDERWSVDDLDEKIELVEDITGSTTTTIDSETDTETELVADNDGSVEDSDIDTTSNGRYDLRSVRRS